jgi:hypothetical protein
VRERRGEDVEEWVLVRDDESVRVRGGGEGGGLESIGESWSLDVERW